MYFLQGINMDMNRAFWRNPTSPQDGTWSRQSDASSRTASPWTTLAAKQTWLLDSILHLSSGISRCGVKMWRVHPFEDFIVRKSTSDLCPGVRSPNLLLFDATKWTIFQVRYTKYTTGVQGIAPPSHRLRQTLKPSWKGVHLLHVSKQHKFAS